MDFSYLKLMYSFSLNLKSYFGLSQIRLEFILTEKHKNLQLIANIGRTAGEIVGEIIGDIIGEVLPMERFSAINPVIFFRIRPMISAEVWEIIARLSFSFGKTDHEW